MSINEAQMTAYTALPDESLSDLARRGDRDAEEILVKRYNRLVRQLARPFYLAGGDSDDLIQEAQPVKPQRTLWLRWGAAAACLCLIAAGGLAALSGSEGTSQDAAETTTSRGSQSPLPYQHSNALPPPPPCDTGTAGSISQDACTFRYAHTRDFSRQRQQLEDEAVIPLMEGHPIFSCQARYAEDGSLACLQLSWSRRGERENYSELSI